MNTIKLNTIGTPFPKAEGGGGDTPSGGGGSTWRYFDVTQVASAKLIVKDIAMIVNCTVDSLEVKEVVTSAGIITASDIVVHGFGVDESVKFKQGNEEFVLKDALNSLLPEFIEMGAKEITEEEFYNLG